MRRYAAFSNHTRDPRIQWLCLPSTPPRLYRLQHTQPSLKTRGEGERFHDWAIELNFGSQSDNTLNYNILFGFFIAEIAVRVVSHYDSPGLLSQRTYAIRHQYPERIGRARWIATQFHQDRLSIRPIPK